MWSYWNPVKIEFGTDSFDTLPAQIGNSAYAVVTYPEPHFQDLVARLTADAGKPALVVDDVAPNPDYVLLGDQCKRFSDLDHPIELIVAIGGGSVIDSAKVFSAANGDFETVKRFLEKKDNEDPLSEVPIMAVPTTAGTGSEVTPWATVWDDSNKRKFSLSRPGLFPVRAVVDPKLMIGKPRGLTLATGLDSLSHALESIWNVNANPVSARHAVAASRAILDHLPDLLDDPENIELRTRLAEASLNAGLAFSNTKTAIAHNISYAITLNWGVQHGIACSFTLPAVLKSVMGMGGFREDSLKAVLGDDLNKGADRLQRFLSDVGVGYRFADQGVPEDQRNGIIDDAFEGERGRNFVGTKERFYQAAQEIGAL